MYEAAGAAAVVLGFIVLPLPFASAAPHGSALIFAGAGWWTIHRAQRTGKPRLVWAVQVLLACGIIAVGMFRLGHFVHGADPQGWSYWLTENQTYKHTRSKALPLLWVPAVGVAWLGLLGIVWSARRLARTGGRRNNPGPQ